MGVGEATTTASIAGSSMTASTSVPHPAPYRAAHLAGGTVDRVADHRELRARVDVDRVGVHPADPATADQTQPHHGALLSLRS